MYRSITVENFKCFREITIPDLKRVNLFTGKNNVGKTALLEAIFLSLGPTNMRLSMQCSVLRGIQHVRLDAESIWGLDFYRGDISKPIRIRMCDYDGKEYELAIRLSEPEEEIISSSEVTSGNGGGRAAFLQTERKPSRLTAEFTHSDGSKHHSHAEVVANGIKVQEAKVRTSLHGTFISSRAPGEVKEQAEYFSSLMESRRKDTLLDPLKLIEPRLKDLVLLYKGDLPLIAGEIDMGPPIPLPLMGEGVNRLTSMILAVSHEDKGGAVLVDEVENGFHHSVLEEEWKSLVTIAKESDVQLFLTTHSWDCVQAAHRVFSSSEEYDLGLYRIERSGEQTRVITYDKESIDGSIKFEMEVR